MKAKFETDVTRKYFVNRKEVQELIGCGPTTAINYIRNWNRELEAKGVFIIAGKCPRDYVVERLGLSGMMEKEAAKNGTAR